MPQVSLAAARVNAGLTQQAVALKVGITPKTLGSYEKGHTAIPHYLFLELSKLYDMPTDYIRLPVVFDGSNDEEPNFFN